MTGEKDTGAVSNPRVSVLLTVYNGLPYVEAAIESILSQTFDEFEFVIVDDGSTDGTTELLKSYDDPRINLHIQANSGRAKALETGRSVATGKYIAVIDADDTAESQRLERQVSVLDTNPSVALVGAWYFRRYEREVGHPTEEMVKPPTEHEALIAELPARNPFAHSLVMYRAAVADRVGGYDETMDSCIDYRLWVQIASAGYRVQILDEVLGTIRKHDKRAFKLSGKKQLRYLLTAFSVRWEAATSLDLPFYTRLLPVLMITWAIVPTPLQNLIRKVR
ncbi:glycosyltransferase family 2 protein [Haladaptatus sp. ZSTT2]|uniref:glycosyltransferase family 2 protein n=1 Tax=Haladaptatus sp. ZSTT2 TaxID=3120515 RepID=UPI00300EF3F3